MTKLMPPRSPQGFEVLVADDDAGIRQLLTDFLGDRGLAVASTGDGRAAVAALERSAGCCRLVFADVSMPGADGFAVLTAARAANPSSYVVMITGYGSLETAISAVRLGAQDYLTKPFSLDELLARIRARLRGEGHPAGDVIRAGEISLDTWRLRADIGAGPIELTRLEFLLLRELMEHPGTSVPKEQLLASVWGLQFDPGSNVVDVCVRRLRSKLGFETIKTVRGEGYQLAIS
jgi:two-component system, OmpR family, response regulator